MLIDSDLVDILCATIYPFSFVGVLFNGYNLYMRLISKSTYFSLWYINLQIEVWNAKRPLIIHVKLIFKKQLFELSNQFSCGYVCRLYGNIPHKSNCNAVLPKFFTIPGQAPPHAPLTPPRSLYVHNYHTTPSMH